MKKTKAMLLKEFNSLQKDYLKAVRGGNLEEAEQLSEARSALRESLRKVDERYVKKE